MDFLNHREGSVVSFQVFLLSPLQCTVTHCTVETVRGCVILKKYKSQGTAVGDFEQQGGKLFRILSEFRPRIWPQYAHYSLMAVGSRNQEVCEQVYREISQENYKVIYLSVLHRNRNSPQMEYLLLAYLFSNVALEIKMSLVDFQIEKKRREHLF